MRHDLRAINRDLASTAHIWVPRLLPNGVRFGRDWRVGSVGGEPGGSLSVTLTGNKAGVWVDNSTGDTGGPLNLIMAVLQCNLPAAIAAAKDIANLPVQEHEKQKIPTDEERKANAEGWIGWLFLWRKPIKDTPAEQYLRNRGIKGDYEGVYYHHELWHAPTQKAHPGMVAFIYKMEGHKKGRLVGIHRTYLTLRGEKANISPNKMMMGECLGGWVTLRRAGGIPDDPFVGICEGIETGFSVLELFPHIDVVIAGLSAAGLAAIPAPDPGSPNKKKVEIFADKGKAGEEAAEKLRSKYAANGVDCKIVLPKSGDDFNTDLMEGYDWSEARDGT